MLSKEIPRFVLCHIYVATWSELRRHIIRVKYMAEKGLGHNSDMYRAYHEPMLASMGMPKAILYSVHVGWVRETRFTRKVHISFSLQCARENLVVT